MSDAQQRKDPWAVRSLGLVGTQGSGTRVSLGSVSFIPWRLYPQDLSSQIEHHPFPTLYSSSSVHEAPAQRLSCVLEGQARV